MAKSVEIPQDIIDNVIAAVGDDNRLLKQCTLVSSSFLLPSRKQLFSTITLNCDQICQGIHQFLVQNPVIQSSVRAISLETSRPYYTRSEWMNGTSLLAILQLPFCRLERFTIRINCDWSSFSSELKDALLNIIHSSTLKTLSLTDITNVPITVFLHIVHLTTLELSLLHFCDENSNTLTRAASKGVAPIASDTVIDRCVWYLREDSEEHTHGTIFPSSAYFPLIQDREGRNNSIFLPFMCRLRFFKIDVNLGSATVRDFEVLSFLMGSLCISLTSPATLEHLEFNIFFRGSDNNFIHSFDRFYEDLRDADAWSHLDSIASHPTGSRLQRVDINIDYTFRDDDNVMEPPEDEVLEAVLDGLPLLHTKGILFVKAFSEYYHGFY
jgi:hypothetical protein